MFGVDIQLKTMLFGRLQNGLSGLIADIWVVIQSPGHRTDGIAGNGGKIFDCHSSASFHNKSTVGWGLASTIVTPWQDHGGDKPPPYILLTGG